jgi:tRNA A-37 threonylcarbamoyl transferase component Bud32
MVLTSRNLVYYLLDRRLATFDSVVDGDIMVVDVSSRNRNFKVFRKHAPSYFVKQVKTWEPPALASLQCEATCYWLSQNDADFAPLQAILPRFHAYDPASHVVVVELIRDGENLSEYHRRLGAFPVEVAKRLGESLGAYHRGGKNGYRLGSHAAAFPKNVPWILSFHRQGAHLFGSLSAANSQLLAVLQRYPEFQSALDALRGRWQVNGLIHGDMKWENCIVSNGSEGSPGIKIVDWELADLGDSCWDVGAVFQAYLSCWILSLPAAGGATPGQLLAQAGYPLEAMQPAIRAFWHSYVASLDRGVADHRELLERCVMYGAARMIQTAFEYMSYSPQITANALQLLQVSLNILTRPREAIHDLLAL